MNQEGKRARYKSYQDKLLAAAELYFAAKALKKAYLRKLNPKWSEDTLNKKVNDWMLHAGS